MTTLEADDRSGRRASHSPVAASLGERLLLVGLALAIVAVFVVLARVQPDARGFGTHEQLGLAPCSWPALYGKPCPTCGVTTAACLLIQLQPVAAVRTQPFGVAFTLAGLVFALLAIGHAWRGESLMARLARWPLLRLSLAMSILLLLSWWYCVATFTAG